MELGTKINQIDLVQFKIDLESYAEEVQQTYGRWRKIEINVPTGIEKVCFVQHSTFTERPLYIQQQGICRKESDDYNFLMCQAWQDDTTRNVYTEPFDELETGIYLGSIEVSDADTDYLCIDTSSHTLKIKMTGKGDRTLIEEW